MGEIHDEFDPALPVRSAAGNVCELDGLLNRDELQERTGIVLPEGRYDTLGGFIQTELGRIPDTGDTLDTLGHRFNVVEMDGRRVARISITPRRPPEFASTLFVNPHIKLVDFGLETVTRRDLRRRQGLYSFYRHHSLHRGGSGQATEFNRVPRPDWLEAQRNVDEDQLTIGDGLHREDVGIVDLRSIAAGYLLVVKSGIAVEHVHVTAAAIDWRDRDSSDRGVTA